LPRLPRLNYPLLPDTALKIELPQHSWVEVVLDFETASFRSQMGMDDPQKLHLTLLFLDQKALDIEVDGGEAHIDEMLELQDEDVLEELDVDGVNDDNQEGEELLVMNHELPCTKKLLKSLVGMESMQ